MLLRHRVASWPQAFVFTDAQLRIHSRFIGQVVAADCKGRAQLEAVSGRDSRHWSIRLSLLQVHRNIAKFFTLRLCPPLHRRVIEAPHKL